MEMIDWALKYAEHGYYIFPCREKFYGKRLNNKTGRWDDLEMKRPFGELTPHGFKDATRDIDKIKYWWKRYPNALVGASCGDSKIFVVDLDRHNNGIDGIDAWFKLGINDDGCGKVVTPSGSGLHIYFDDPDNLGRNKTDENTGVDSRGRGGYVILPPSEVQYEDGTKKKYSALTDMFKPKKVLTLEIAEKLGLIRKPKENRGKYTIQLSEDEEFKQAVNLIESFPYEVINNYEYWLRVGLYLRKFGDAGRDLWFKWSTEKYLSVNPHSKRNNLEYKWESILEKKEEMTIGTLLFLKKEFSELADGEKS